MARTAPTSPISPKMFRHFAIATVIITGCIAMFADEENREVLEEQMAHQHRSAQLTTREQELAAQGKGGNTHLAMKDNRRNTVTWAAEGDLTVEDVSVNTLDVPLQIVEAEYTGPDLPDPQTLAPPPGMSSEQFEEMLRLKKKRTTGKAKPTPEELSAMLARSRARSGAPDED